MYASTTVLPSSTTVSAFLIERFCASSLIASNGWLSARSALPAAARGRGALGFADGFAAVFLVAVLLAFGAAFFAAFLALGAAFFATFLAAAFLAGFADFLAPDFLVGFFLPTFLATDFLLETRGVLVAAMVGGLDY